MKFTRQLSLHETVQKLWQEIFRLKPTMFSFYVWVEIFRIFSFVFFLQKLAMFSFYVWVEQVPKTCHFKVGKTKYHLRRHSSHSWNFLIWRQNEKGKTSFKNLFFNWKVKFFSSKLGLYQFARPVISKYERQIIF